MTSSSRLGSLQVTFQAIKDQIGTVAASEVQKRLQEIGDHAVDISPVDTGAYVESFSIVKAGSGGGRSRVSKGKPRQQNPEAKKQVAKAQLAEDVSRLNIKEDMAVSETKYTLRNRAPHSKIVEDGESWAKRDGYFVFTEIRRKFT